MNDTRERFLAAIVRRLGADPIVELHLFSPIRQGVLETGVAVVAVVPPMREGEGYRVWEGEGEGAAAQTEPVTNGTAEPVAALPSASSVADALAVAPTADAHSEPVPPDEPVDEAEAAAVEEVDPSSSPSHTLTLPLHPGVVIYTARYRLTRKGPDRGKWWFEAAATADAPLVTVDQVVRGVIQRSKDLTETERLSGEQLRALLREPAWRTPT
jgi:hypothetical protein